MVSLEITYLLWTLHQSWSNQLTAQVWFIQWNCLLRQPMTFIMNVYPEGIFTRSVVHSAPLTPNTRARENYEPLSIYTREKSIRQQVEGLLGTDRGLKQSLRRLYWPKSHTHSLTYTGTRFSSSERSFMCTCYVFLYIRTQLYSVTSLVY